jgi:hypothetical protein
VDEPAPSISGGEASEDPDGYNPYLVIVARDDDTRVSVHATAPIGGGPGVPSAFPGDTIELDMESGEYVQFVEHSLQGVRVAANRPVGVFVGHQCATLPIDALGDCDHVQQMLIPTSELSWEYAVHGSSRVGEPMPWRIVGMTDGTVLEYSDGVTGPVELAAGESREFESAGPFVVRSQDEEHAFRLSALMYSCSTLPVPTCLGDPELVELTGPDHFVGDTIFYVDPTFERHQIALVRERPADDEPFADVAHACATDGLIVDWQPIGDDARFEAARLDFDVPSTPYEDCEPGLHRLVSGGRFTAWVWSWDGANSIGYPIARGNLPVDVPAP